MNRRNRASSFLLSAALLAALPPVAPTPVAALPAGAAAQTTQAAQAAQLTPLSIPRLTGPVEIDGRVDEAAWMAIAPLPVVGSTPVFGGPPSERTEFRLAYDDEYLYLSGRMHDSDPSGIRATSLRRDDTGSSNDWMVLVLDTFMDRRTSLVFGVTPAGIRTDVSVPNDADGTFNSGWDAYWDAATTTDAGGWSAEIRIPLSTLRFEVEDGRVLMGATVYRRIARRNEYITWPAIEQRWGFNSLFKASLTHPVVMAGVERRNPIYITPFALSGPSRRNQLDASGTAWQPQDNWTRDVGLDVKLSPSSNLVIDLTANTDFAQVEADDQQVNLTRFSLFFPERRLFFQERSELFDFSMGGSDRLFYTRRIGLVDGAPTRIYGGARATGRIGTWDLGAMNLQTAASGVTGSENSGVVRMRRQVLNPDSYVGVLATSRIESGGSRSLAGGTDALVHLGGSDYLSVAVAASAFREAGAGVGAGTGAGTGAGAGAAPGAANVAADPAGAPERLFARARWERRGIYGLEVDAEVAHVGAAFQPTLGFLARRDHLRTTGTVGWGWPMPEGSFLLRQQVRAGFQAYRRYDDGALESGEFTPTWFVEALDGRTLTVTGAIRYEDLVRGFSLGPDLSVPEGRYRYGSVRIAYAPSTANPLRLGADAEAGGFYDGSLVSASLTPTWNASRHLEVSGAWQVNRIAFSGRGQDRDQERVAHVGRLRTVMMLNTRLSGVALVQINTATDALLVNLRLRYNPREGNDLYVVYNHGLVTDRFGYDPARPLTENQTLLIKYSHTLRLER